MKFKLNFVFIWIQINEVVVVFVVVVGTTCGNGMLHGTIFNTTKPTPTISDNNVEGF